MEKWIQVYDPLKGLGPEYLLSALVAGVPLYILLYMLGIRRSAGHKAAFCGTLAAVLLAIFVWGMPAGAAVGSTLMGAAFGLFPIVWIIISAVWLYNMTVESGEFEIIKSSLANLTEDRRLQALFIAFAFSSFIEGTAGFGTPVAITAAMLVGLGFSPLYAAGICLVANTPPVAFGGVGIPLITAAGVTGTDLGTISKIAGIQLPILAIIVPFWISFMMCGVKRSMEILPAILTAGVCFAASQFLLAQFHGPYIVDIVGSAASIIGLILLLRVWKPASIFRFADEAQSASVSNKKVYSGREILRAWSSYIIMAVLVFIWGLPAFKSWIASFNIAVQWPGVHGHIFQTAPIAAVEKLYNAVYGFNFPAAAGTAIVLSGLIGSLLMPGYGLGKAIACLLRTVKQLRFSIATIAMILGLAYIMNYSGMSATMGLAFTKTGGAFPFFAPLLGWLGVFLTGSDTSSNALFGNLQKTTAQLLGIDEHLTVAANATGGVAGKMISPQSISVAASSTGLIGKEGNILSFTFFHSLGMTLLICLMTLLQAYWFSWTLPSAP